MPAFSHARPSRRHSTASPPHRAEASRSKSAPPPLRQLDERQIGQITAWQAREHPTHSPQAGQQNEVDSTLIAEGQVGIAPAGSDITYGAVTSCMTVTCHFNDGRKAGAHMVLATDGSTQLSSHEILPALRSCLNGTVARVELVGDFESWQTKYFTLPAFEGGYDLPHDPRPLHEAVLEEIGLRHIPVEMRQHDEGTLIIGGAHHDASS